MAHHIFRSHITDIAHQTQNASWCNGRRNILSGYTLTDSTTCTFSAGLEYMGKLVLCRYHHLQARLLTGK
jgi:hypothetical protein